MIRALFLAGCVAIGAAIVVGCGQKTPTMHDAITVESADQIRKVAGAYKSASGKRRAVTVDDIKQAMKQEGNVDKALISPRDGKPFVIVPGVTGQGDEDPIIAYEQDGVGGKRMTVDIRGTVVLISDADFAKLKFAGGHQPAR